MSVSNPIDAPDNSNLNNCCAICSYFKEDFEYDVASCQKHDYNVQWHDICNDFTKEANPVLSKWQIALDNALIAVYMILVFGMLAYVLIIGPAQGV